MRKVRAILIDPFACTVTEVEHDADNYKNIYALLSHESMPVDCFTCAYANKLQPGEAIFVDDDGLLKRCDRFFMFAGYVQPLAGKGLILGSNGAGDTVGATSALSTIKRRVTFAERAGAGLMETNQPWQKENTNA